MTTLYTIDPSTRATGIAAFNGRALISVCMIEAKSVDEMIRHIGAFFTPKPHSALIVETPSTYPGKDRVSPDKIAKVVLVAGACRAHFHTSTSVTQHQWTRGVPYEIREKRIQALLSANEAAMVERVKKSVRDNAYDAVGIGLWHLGRTA